MQIYLSHSSRDSYEKGEGTRMDKNWRRTIFTGLNIYFAAKFYYCAIKLAVTDKLAIPYAIVGLLRSVIAVPPHQGIRLGLRKR